MTDYYNLNGKLVRNVDDGKTDRIMLLINSKKDDKVNAAIEQGSFIKVPSNKVVDKMEEAYNLTENTGKEHGFRVGNKGTISTMVSGRETEIGPDEWKPAVSSIVEQGDLASYDVHTHPKPKYEQGSQTIPFNNMPSETDQMNTVGNQPSVVLGYYFQEIRNLNTFGSGQTDVSLHRSICFYNKNGAINSEEIRFSDFKISSKKRSTRNNRHMRVLLFIALFVWNTAIRAQTAKLTDMGTYWMFKSYVSIAMPDGNFLYQYPSYMFPLPKTLKWYTEIPGKLMFILDKKQTIFVEIINTEILNDTTYIPSEDFMIDIISENSLISDMKEIIKPYLLFWRK